MPTLLLIKHAAPLVDPATPSASWRLSEKGIASCDALADRLAPFKPSRVVSSFEPKASETAERVAARLAIPCATAEGLHEHDRSNVPHLRTAEFISLVELFFRRPTQLVLGTETAADALDRFAEVVEPLCAGHETLAVVAHGTVISLLLEDRCGLDPFPDLARDGPAVVRRARHERGDVACDRPRRPRVTVPLVFVGQAFLPV